MWTKDVIERLKKEWGIEVNDDTLFFYDRINLVPIQQKKHGEGSYREYTEKDYIKLSKAILLSKEFSVSLYDIDQMLNKKNKELKEKLLKSRSRGLRYLKEVL